MDLTKPPDKIRCQIWNWFHFRHTSFLFRTIDAVWTDSPNLTVRRCNRCHPVPEKSYYSSEPLPSLMHLGGHWWFDSAFRVLSRQSLQQPSPVPCPAPNIPHARPRAKKKQMWEALLPSFAGASDPSEAGSQAVSRQPIRSPSHSPTDSWGCLSMPGLKEGGPTVTAGPGKEGQQVDHRAARAPFSIPPLYQVQCRSIPFCIQDRIYIRTWRSKRMDHVQYTEAIGWCSFDGGVLALVIGNRKSMISPGCFQRCCDNAILNY